MNKWEVLKNIDLGTVDRDSLVDIDDVVIDESLSKEERIRSYIRQIKNPYCFKCGSVVVKVSYAEDGEPLETIMERLILSL